MKLLIKSAWGSDDPTKACSACILIFAEAVHEVQIFLLQRAVPSPDEGHRLIAALTPVGWPPLSEIMPKTIARHHA